MSTPDPVAAIEALASPPGQALLARIGEYAGIDPLRCQLALRAQGHDPGLIAAALTQARLRERARDKFGAAAERMFFTADGVEQATRPEVAARHAARFAGAVPAGVTVADLGCGVGSDAMAFAAAGLGVDAVDADPAAAACAALNLRGWPTASASRALAEESLPADPAVGIWFDPARRLPGRGDIVGRATRVWSLAELSPSWEFIESAATGRPWVGAKLAPAFPAAAIPAGAEAEWVSWRGTVVECALWWPGLARVVGRTATVLRPGHPAVTVTEADGVGADPPGGAVLAYLHEADKAVIRAGLVEALARATDGHELHPGTGYVASDRPVAPAYARSFRVIEAMPLHPKAVRAWLRRRGVRGATLKIRGLGLSEPRIRRDLGLGEAHGDDALLVLTRHAGAPVCVVVEPLSSP